MFSLNAFLRGFTTNWLLVLCFALILSSDPSHGAEKNNWTLRLETGRGRNRAEPVWIASDLEMLLRRVERERETETVKADQNGVFMRLPPMEKFPAWTRCQELALQSRPEMILVRINLAGLKAARRLLSGRYDDHDEDSLGRNLPGWFSAENWGEEILRDFRLVGCSREKMRQVVYRQLDQVTVLFTEWRDRINHEVALACHTLERARIGGKADQIRAACWKLWITIGCP